MPKTGGGIESAIAELLKAQTTILDLGDQIAAVEWVQIIGKDLAEFDPGDGSIDWPALITSAQEAKWPNSLTLVAMRKELAEEPK